MRPARFERLSTVAGGLSLAGAFYHYVLVNVMGASLAGLFQGAIEDVVHGHAQAPYQYRFLVPTIWDALASHTGASLEQVAVVWDGAALCIGVTLGVALLRRLGLSLFTFPALLYCAFLMTGLLPYWKPETVTAFACTTAALLALERHRAWSGWWSPAVIWIVLAAATVLLVGSRTDLLAALAAGFLARWWQRRQRADLAVAVLLVVTAFVATEVLVRVYPDAHYPPGNGLVQLAWSLGALPMTVAGCFVAAVLAPAVFLWRSADGARPLRDATADRLPEVAVVVAEFVLSAMFGRIDEIRLLFPVALYLAIIGVTLWRAAVVSIAADELDDVDAPLTRLPQGAWPNPHRPTP